VQERSRRLFLLRRWLIVQFNVVLAAAPESKGNAMSHFVLTGRGAEQPIFGAYESGTTARMT
jgi:hypothetical protein